MKEIIFKAKRINWRELSKSEWWVEGLIWKKKYNTSKIFMSSFPDKDDREELFVIVPETICQCIGLTDKNGRKIFEKDVCRYNNSEGESGIAIIREDYAEWRSGIISKKEIMTPLFYLKCSEEWEVIGNIFDNPDLIGAQVENR